METNIERKIAKRDFNERKKNEKTEENPSSSFVRSYEYNTLLQG